ncbi:MAG: TetR/AcrR family transcriptional regulator [Chitinispirillaceae bacterium]|nr:TetR/AcrR family transcriptional regulator [Chitinispirillaceae bacterium]
MSKYTERQLQIIDTAIKLIAEGGIQEFTMKHLAVRIGISEPAIYRHFENKTAILEAIQSIFAKEKREFFDKIIISGMSGIEKILRIIESHFLTFSQKPAMAAVIFSEDIFQNEPRIAEIAASIMEQSRRELLRIITDGQAKGSLRGDIPAEHIVILIMGSLRLIVKKWNISRHGFDLVSEGRLFFESLKKILKPER